MTDSLVISSTLFFINYGGKQIDIGLGKSKKCTITLHTKLDLGNKKKEIFIVHKVLKLDLDRGNLHRT